MRSTHRIVSLFVVLITLYLGCTGTVVQLIDLQTLFRHAPATDPEMKAMREDKDGPDDYAVLEATDYSAEALPADFDLQAAMPKLMAAARASSREGQVDYAELRMRQSAVVGVVQLGQTVLQYDFATGQQVLGPEPTRERGPPISLRNDFKHLHRMTTFGDWALWINPLVGIALGLFVFTGLVMYWQLLKARRRIKKQQLFWFAGDWWRTLHRAISAVASLFIVVIALSGTWLAVESLVFSFYLRSHLPQPGQPMPQPPRVAPLTDTQVAAMLPIALQSYRARLAEQPIKVLRLRHYGGMAQAVFVVGMADDTRQVVFDTATGREASLTEPGYPSTGFPFGWQAHQIAKQVHRGSYIGMSGRWMDLLGGLALVYLSISGAVMYVQMWRRRRRSGRTALLWT